MPEAQKFISDEAPNYEIENFQALENYVLLRKLQVKSHGGIVFPDGVAEDALGVARVLSVGPGCCDPKGHMHYPDVKVGDIVFVPFALIPVDFLIGTVQCWLCRDTMICGKFAVPNGE